jgi:hypothetical protein
VRVSAKSSSDVQYTMQDLWYNHVVSTNDWRRDSTTRSKHSIKIAHNRMNHPRLARPEHEGQ